MHPDDILSVSQTLWAEQKKFPEIRGQNSLADVLGPMHWYGPHRAGVFG